MKRASVALFLKKYLPEDFCLKDLVWQYLNIRRAAAGYSTIF
jgi:hypothetical protein